MSLEMFEMPWKCCWPYCMPIPDLETLYGMAGRVSKAFCTHFDIFGCFLYWNAVYVVVSCNLEFQSSRHFDVQAKAKAFSPFFV